MNKKITGAKLYRIYETLKELTKANQKHHEIMLQWIPGHCNIPGNTAADVAARQAHRKNIVSIPISENELRSILKPKSFNMCRNTWFDQNSKSCDLYHIDPLIEFEIPLSLDRCVETLIHR